MDLEFNNFLQKNNKQAKKDLLNKFTTNSENIALTKIWYDSLENGNPDYSVYEDDFFLYASLDCFKKYSSKYIKLLIKNDITKDILLDCSTICDVGNGLGYSTKLLKQLLPSVKVYGQNIETSLQYKYNEYIGNDMISLEKQEIDCFIFFDFMEHIEKPIEYINDIITNHNPKVLIFANSFNTKCIGHFTEYKHNDEIIDQTKIGRKFNKNIRDNDFKKVETKFWNSRPNVFLKVV